MDAGGKIKAGISILESIAVAVELTSNRWRSSLVVAILYHRCGEKGDTGDVRRTWLLQAKEVRLLKHQKLTIGHGNIWAKKGYITKVLE